MQEIELKFLVPSYKITAIKRQTHIKASIQSHLAAHYFDTEIEDLAKNSMAIRIRREDQSWVQTLKTSGDGIASRLEHNHQLDSESAERDYENKKLVPDLSIYTHTPIDKVFKKIKKTNGFNVYKSKHLLVCLYSTDVYRTTRLVKKAGTTIEIAFDEGQVIHGINIEKTQPIQEVEFELIEGDVQILFEVAKLWCKRYKLCFSTITKAARGRLLLQDKLYSDVTHADLKSLNYNDSVTQPEFIRHVVHNCLLQILPNASAIISGSQDGNHIHQLRVGIRRLRTVIKFFGDFSNQIKNEWLLILKQTFTLLGEYRDYEILSKKTQPQLALIGAPDLEWKVDVKVKPVDAVSANDFQIMLLEMIEFVMSDTKIEVNDKLAKLGMTKVLNKLFNKIEQAGSQFNYLDIESQHKVRKQLKALRYVSEFAIPIYATKHNNKQKKRSKKFLKYICSLQELLGDYNDSLVGYAYYQQRVDVDPKAYFAVGWFLANQKHSEKLCTEALQEMKYAPVFW